ncbi:NAD(P)H-dependent oxidoreductase [Ursidibacter sp. B-7004-1]
MKNVLIISGHPNLAQSTANSLIISEVQKQLENVEVRRLDTLYPDYQIDVSAEQDALSRADVIVWQFPFYWYSTPALLKKWIDDVHTHGFAYGSDGNKLHGKKLIVSFTTGGSADDYSVGGHEGMQLPAFFPQFSQTAHLCGMDFQAPIYSQGMHYIAGVSSSDELASVKAKAIDHSTRLVQHIQSL